MEKEILNDYNAYYHYSSMAQIKAIQLKIEALEKIALKNCNTKDLEEYNNKYINLLKEDKEYNYLKETSDNYKSKLDI
jgi:hypothetical protein